MEETNNTSPSKRTVLGVALLSLLVTLFGISVVTDGTEAIASALKADTGAAEWIFKAYVIAFAVLLVVGGKLNDLFGRRKALLAGLAVLGVGSAAAGAVSDINWLIASRAVQGVGAALVLPATLALILDAFPRRRRGTAFGYWTAVLAVAFAGGVALSGLAIDELSWRWLFYGNAILALAAILSVFRLIPGTPRRSGGLDLPGALTVTGALAALAFAVLEGQNAGWGSPLVTALFALSATQLLAFVLVERRQSNPLVSLARLGSRDFGIGSLIMFLASAGILGSFFLVTLQLQQVLGYSAVDTAAALAPLAAVILVVAPLAGKLAHRFDSRLVAAAGLLLASGSLWGLAMLEATSTRVDFVLPLAVLGLGAALVLPVVTAVALDDTSPSEYGSASGTFGAARNMGALVGVAVAGSVFVAQIGSQVPKALAGNEQAQQGISEQIKLSIEQNGVDLLQLDEAGAGLTGAQRGPGGPGFGGPGLIKPFPREADALPVLGTVAQAVPPQFGPGGPRQQLTPQQQARQQRQLEEQQRQAQEQAERQQFETESAIDEGITDAAGRTFRYLSVFTLLGALATIYLGRRREGRGETENA